MKKLFKCKKIYYLMMSNNIFTDNKNKALLWEILQDSFDNIDQNEYNNFKQFFETHIETLNINMEKNGNTELLEKNKFFIQNTLLLIKNNQWKNIYNKELYTSDEIKEKNMNEFEQRFLQRQKEFTNLINIKKPEELSFEDNNNSFNEDINIQLERMQRERDKEVDFNYNNESSGAKKIKIIEEDLPKKKVTFNNLIDNIEINESVVQDTIKIDFINDIKGDINLIKNEIFELKNMLNQLINREN